MMTDRHHNSPWAGDTVEPGESVVVEQRIYPSSNWPDQDRSDDDEACVVRERDCVDTYVTILFHFDCVPSVNVESTAENLGFSHDEKIKINFVFRQSTSSH